MNQEQKKSERDLESEGFSFYESQPLRNMTVFARQNLKTVEFRTVLKDGQIKNGNLLDQ